MALSADATIAQQDGNQEVRACLSTTVRQEMKILYFAHRDGACSLLDPGSQSREQAMYVQKGCPPALDWKEGELRYHTLISHLPQW